MEVEPLEKFLATLGHELRNPLAVIVTALHVIRERDGGLQRETAIIERQANQLVRLISDLLDVSRVTNGEIPLQRRPTDLETAIAQAVETASPHILGRGHALAIDVAEEIYLDADPERLAQVLSNVLINAALYTPRCGRITLTARRDGATARITIRDTGIGISAELLPRIFEPFVQGRKTRSHHESGLGIGLTMARMLVGAHGGTIEASSSGVGRGTELAIHWPCACPRALRTSRPLRVLVIDDSKDASDQFADMLRALGHEPHIVHDGETAREVIERCDPHVALVHLGLRSIDCYELVERLRALPGAVSRTFVGLASADALPDPERARTAGFARSVARPVDLASLRFALGDSDEPASS